MSSTRNIPILSALTSIGEVSRFVPYMLDSSLQSEQQFFPSTLNTSEYDIASYATDNRKVTEWFSDQLQLGFNQWLNPKFIQPIPPVRVELTGSRSFNASYTESDLECAVVSENFEDFLKFCRYLQINYGAEHNFIPMKTKAGLPLLIIKNETGFSCQRLSAHYENKKLPQLEVTFRHPNVHDIIQNAGINFFSSLSLEQLKSYIDNKRYIALIEKNMPRDAMFESESLKKGLEEFKGILSAALKCLPSGQLQDTPPFDKKVFAEEVLAKAIKEQTMLAEVMATHMTMFQPAPTRTDSVLRSSGPRPV